MKKTQWFPPDVLPVRDGVYEFESDWYRLFKDGEWHVGSSELWLARLWPRERLLCKNTQRWRGLASDPEKWK